MKRIASFEINHDTLEPGLYISRVDDNIVTYDLRVIRPNSPPFMDNDEMHTVEHLFSTFVRNSEFESSIVYFGPMGCRTGFYFLTRDLSHQNAIALTQKALDFISAFEGVIPGASKIECGNYLEHDLTKAKLTAQKMSKVLSSWKEENLTYPS